LPPAELLAKLSLNPDRTYEVRGNYYVDSTPNTNNTKWAVLDNGVLRETTLEEKYGDLAPLNPSEPYQNMETWVLGDDFHNRDENYKSQILDPVWTGDSFVRQVDDQGGQISEEDGIFVMRDLNGVMRQVNIRFDSDDINGGFKIYITTQVSGTTTHTEAAIVDPKILPLGKQLKVYAYYKVPKNAVETARFYSGVSTDEYKAGLRRFWAQETGIQAFIDALRAGEKVTANSDLVVIPRSIYVDETVNK
jgi:hypothetical protein